ncbi:hypothetical protein FQN49_000384 [Arthroderma sp. PD_2]|nr:hypothetical protein FQN49_000384 [Arthroderma sp. PD_2]
MDFVKNLAGGSSKSSGSGGDKNNENINKGIDFAQSKFVKSGQGNNDNINKGIDFAQKSFLGNKDKPTEEKK